MNVQSTTSSTTNTNGLSFTGLATGIDTSSIITGLTQLNTNSINALKAQQSTITTKQTTFAALQADLFDLQSKTSALSQASSGAFDARTATASDPTVLTAAAGTAAIPGNYSITVGSLAQAAQVASNGYSDPNATIKQGTLTLQVGTDTATTITVDSRNNTLQGLAQAINASSSDVTATIINDGSSSPYRLLLSSSQTGASSTINVTNNLTTGTGADINPTATTIQAASDAQITLGSGTGAITVSNPTNQVNNLIPGVSLNLLTAKQGEAVNLTVAPNTDAISSALQDFVTSYNTAISFINTQSTYDPTTQTAGVLLGNADASGLKDELSNALTTSVGGLNTNANRLSSVGLSFNSDGTLALDQTKLSQALSGQSGASITDLKNLFALSGTSNNPGVSFVFGSNATQPSGAGGYGVQITSPATRATVSATSPLPSSVTLDATNNSLLLRLNGLTSSDVTIPAGTYTANDLVTALQQQINSNSALSGNRVSVGLDSNGAIQITSQQYGSGSSVAFAGGSALQALGFTGTEAGSGNDVVGSFTVNGQTEAATGSGQVLTGNSGNANTDGLAVNATVSTPTTASVTVTQGLGSRLNTILNEYLDPTKGKLATINTTFQNSIDDITNTINNQNTVLQAKTAQLTQQFAAMETAVQNLKGVQTQLSSLVSVSYSSSSSK